MIKYDNDAIDELCAGIDLLEYASQKMEFKRDNQSCNWFCKCPKHVDNTPSLSINTDKNLFYCFSCGRGGGIIQWMKEFEGMTFPEALSKVVEISGTDICNYKICDAMAFYKLVEKTMVKQAEDPVQRKILPYSYYDKYDKEIPEEWVKEGISPEVMKEFDIRVDRTSNRIIYPVYDSDGNLIGIKGRTRFENYKALGIAKYMNYTTIYRGDFFQFWQSNLDFIVKANSVIIFEGIKSGMKLTTYTGQRNWVSAETSHLTDEQVILLIKARIKDVTIAFDSDVKMNKLMTSVSKLKQFTNVYAIVDKHHLLGDKESPVDEGKEVWEKLYAERIKI